MTCAAITILLLAQLVPRFSTDGLVNAASYTPGPFAPNTLISLYGENLSFQTRSLSQSDMRGATLPTTLIGTGVRVMIANQLASLFYVSPNQINLLIPSDLRPGIYNFELMRDGLLSPPIPIQIGDGSPQFFMTGHWEGISSLAVATHADGSVIDPGNPAAPGEIIVLYATGLGHVKPAIPYGQIATRIGSITKKENFRIYLNGNELNPHLTEYVGVTPGYGGLYQINLRLPKDSPEMPEIRMGFGSPQSLEGVRLAIRFPDTHEEASDPASWQKAPAPDSR